ncbi:hypothetical protein RRG08_034421 [Elysia crispata]|uniref:Uncharacterized protein n=1 Tax=Elysia crispata TaxID=231223 RepID=A0AAE1CX73_9GAST|nr:hypothetical protein RRG08_034421 [Elysia crispata]
MLLKVGSVSRDDKDVKCLIGGIVSARCMLDIYVIPEKPVCEPLQFTQNGAMIYLRCTADRVYPKARCIFNTQKSAQVGQVQVTHRPSSRHPGDKEVTCELRMPVRSYAAGDYYFRVAVQADVPHLSPDDFVQGDNISLQLNEVALESHIGNEVFEVEEGNDLTRKIRITGNPPPNRFSFMMQPSKDSNSLNVIDSDYTLSYSSGSLQLEL